MKTILKKFGFFESLSREDAQDNIRSLIHALPECERENIVKYLKAGKSLMMVTGIARDRLLAHAPVIGTQHILTDGVWAWTEDVAYYVDKHGITPPREFVETMRNNAWIVPTVTDIGSLQLEV